MRELASVFTYGISKSCVENVLEVNRGNNGKALAGIQARDHCVLDCSGDSGNGKMWLYCRYTLKARSTGLGGGWTLGVREGTKARM